jgi:hypothetical protein
MSSVFQTTITKVLGLAESYPGYARLKLQRDFFKDKPLLQHWNQFDIYVKNYFDTVFDFYLFIKYISSLL